MRRCLELALKGQGRVSPNPMVGAVVLDRRGRLVGEGFHRKAGAAHGEVAALRVAKGKAVGGTLYVNLEPCNHQGRTGPCSVAVAEAGIARVVYGAPDPMAGHGGGGRALSRRGIELTRGLLRRECEIFNRVFLTWAQLQRPHVVLKAGATLDGRSRTGGGESKWITGDRARADGRKLRGQLDAICVGIETVLADDPQLTSRRRGSRDPLRIVFDSELRTPNTAKVLPANSDSSASCLIVTSTEKSAASTRRETRLVKAGAEVVRVKRKRGRLDLGQALEVLSAREVTSLLVEGGPTLAGGFLDHDLVDEVRLYLAPTVFGGPGTGWLTGGGVSSIASAPRFEFLSPKQLGDDLVISALRKR